MSNFTVSNPPFLSLLTWVAMFCPWTGCAPWPSFLKQQYSSSAGLHPPWGTYQGRPLHTGTEEEPCSGSPAPWRSEDEGESGEGRWWRCGWHSWAAAPELGPWSPGCCGPASRSTAGRAARGPAPAGWSLGPRSGGRGPNGWRRAWGSRGASWRSRPFFPVDAISLCGSETKPGRETNPKLELNRLFPQHGHVHPVFNASTETRSLFSVAKQLFRKW